MGDWNFLETIEQIKVSLFTGDLSALYMLACAVACISVLFSLITWYNRAMMEPYGQMDLRAIVRTFFILVITCNFYTCVLLPFDSFTYLITRGITAVVDNDPSGIVGKVNEMYRVVDENYKAKTLSGQLEAEEKRMKQNQTSSGLENSLATGTIEESLLEIEIEQGGKSGWWGKVKKFFKNVVSSVMGQVISYYGSIFSAVVSLLVKLVQYILMGISGIYLLILGLIGPFVFAYSLMPDAGGGINAWIARYIQISFWLPLSSFVDMCNMHIKDGLIDHIANSTIMEQLNFPTYLIVLELITLICLCAIPSFSSWVVQSAGASDANRSIASVAQKTAKVATKIK